MARSKRKKETVGVASIATILGRKPGTEIPVQLQQEVKFEDLPPEERARRNQVADGRTRAINSGAMAFSSRVDIAHQRPVMPATWWG